MWGGNGAHERARDRRGGGLDPDQTAASGGPKRGGGPYRSARTGSVGKYDGFHDLAKHRDAYANEFLHRPV